VKGDSGGGPQVKRRDPGSGTEGGFILIGKPGLTQKNEKTAADACGRGKGKDVSKR